MVVIARQAGRQIAQVSRKNRDGSLVYAVTDGIALYAAFYPTGVFQLFEVLRNGRLRQRQLLDYVAANAARRSQQIFYNGYSCRMPQSLGQSRYAFLFFGVMFRFADAHDADFILILQYYDMRFLNAGNFFKKNVFLTLGGLAGGKTCIEF